MESQLITKDKIQEILLTYLCRQFMVEVEDIDLEKSLVDTGIIDSMGLIEIASFIHTSFGFKVEEHDMNRENFGSVLRIVSFIDRKKQQD